MLAYAVRRVLAVFPVMAVVVLFVFVLLRLAPGDPAAIIAGDYATPEAIAKIRIALGLDQPIYIQLGVYVGSLVRGDLGRSLHSRLPVRTLIVQRLEPTVALALSTLIFAVGLAVPLGVLAAWRAGTWIDRAVMIFAVGGFSIPVFWLGFLMIYGFSVRLDLLPVQGYAPLAAGFGPFARHLILPTLTLGLIYMALITRITRASVLEVLDADYVRTAHAKGQWPGRILFTHALKNAAVPIVTTIGVGLTLLISGVVITESVFALPGLGRLTADAVLQRDYSIIQGVTILSSAVYVVVNLLVDLCYLVLDPRIRY